MSYSDTVETYMRRMDLAHEQLDASTWVVSPDNIRLSQIIVRIDDPIVLFTSPVFTLADNTQNREGLFRRLLELNEDLLHSAYGLQGHQLLMSGAAQAETLDFNEFQAMIDDMSMGFDRHLDELAKWRPAKAEEAS